MKMATLMSIICFVFCLNMLMADSLVSKEIALSGHNYTIKCLFGKKNPTWVWKYNETYNEDIFLDDYPQINPSYHARERIHKDTNNKDLILLNVSKGDAGDYVCSTAKNGTRRSNVYLEVLSPNVWNMTCHSGHFSIATECFTIIDVKTEWEYVSASDGSKVRDMNPISNRISTSGCPTGKAKLISGGDYTLRTGFHRTKVYFRFKFTFNSSGNAQSGNRECLSQDYYIDGMCEFEIISIVCILTMSTFLLIYGSSRLYRSCSLEKDICEVIAIGLYFSSLVMSIILLASISKTCDITAKFSSVPFILHPIAFLLLHMHDLFRWCRDKFRWFRDNGLGKIRTRSSEDKHLPGPENHTDMHGTKVKRSSSNCSRESQMPLVSSARSSQLSTLNEGQEREDNEETLTDI